MVEIIKEHHLGLSKMVFYQDGLIHIHAVGEVGDELAEEARAVSYEIMASMDGPLFALIDLNHARKQSPQARRIWQELCNHEKISKVAIFGLHPVAKLMASFVLGMSRNDNIRFFTTEEQARAWLGE